MKCGGFGAAYRHWRYAGAALLFLLAAGGEGVAQTGAQPAAPGDYYEICLRLGFLPGTTPMRRCLMQQYDNDLDPLTALSEYQLDPPAPEEPGTAEQGLVGEFPGARAAEEFLQRSPEGLLLGPDYRARGQGIYE